MLSLEAFFNFLFCTRCENFKLETGNHWHGIKIVIRKCFC